MFRSEVEGLRGEVPWSAATGDSTAEPHFDGINLTRCSNDSYLNYSSVENSTEGFDRQFDVSAGITSVILGLMILITVIGNVFVIAAILLERNLQNVANYLIVSLAVADLMVACLVMPLGAVYEIMRGWVLGPELCDMWTCCDVLCCTASILHLVAIAVDRYWAVTDLDYVRARNVNRIGLMILVVWTVALIVSLAPQFGWKDPDYLDRINSQKRCLVSQDVAYQVFATCSTFYVPLLVILILYWKIFQTARKRIRKNRKSKPAANRKSDDPDSSENPLIGRSFASDTKFRKFDGWRKENGAAKGSFGSSAAATNRHHRSGNPAQETFDAETKIQEPDAFGSEVVVLQVTTDFAIDDDKMTSSDFPEPKPSEGIGANDGNHRIRISDASRPEIIRSEISGGNISYGTAESIAKAVNPMQIHKEKKESLEAKRERKAAKTLAIITGAFVICWLPFFVMAILMPLFGPISDHLASFFLWLGYFNSTLNPVIYTIFSPEFRQAFKRILRGAPGRNPYHRPGKWR